jgi:hypothetical protein
VSASAEREMEEARSIARQHDRRPIARVNVGRSRVIRCPSAALNATRTALARSPSQRPRQDLNLRPADERAEEPERCAQPTTCIPNIPS